MGCLDKYGKRKGELKCFFFCIMVVGLVLEGVPVFTGSADFEGLSQQLVGLLSFSFA